MTDDNQTNTSTQAEQPSEHPYRLGGTPPLPFDESDASSQHRGIPVYAVLDLGRPNEDPSVDRVFLDESAARHHEQRISSVPTVVIPTHLE